MQRKYIYIIVVILTIALVLVDHYVGLFTDNTNKAVEQHFSDELEEAYNATEISYSLIIKNFQNDNEKTTYTYKIKIPDFVGAQLYTHNGTENYVIFAANGEAEVHLNSNESLIIHNIPEGSNYRIEQVTDVSEKYTTTVNNLESKVIEGTIGSENTIEFNNETIIEEVPEVPEEEEKDNPFTEDNHYLVLTVFIYAIIILFIALRHKIKRFG